MRTTVLLSLPLLLGMPAAASAAQITQVFGETLKLGDDVPEGQDTVSFAVDRFDATLGALTGVAFDLVSDFSGGAVFYHPTLSLTFGYTPRHFLAVELKGIDNAPDLTLDHTLPAQHYTDTTPFGGSYWTPTAQAHDVVTVTVLAGDLVQYVGATPFGLGITIEDRGVYTSSDPLAYVNDKYVFADLTLTVTYTYTSPIPEPASYAMMLAGLGLIGWAARRRVERIY